MLLKKYSYKFVRINIMFLTTFGYAWYKIQNIRNKIFYFIWVLKPLTWCMRVMKIFWTNFSHFGLFSDTLDRRNISSWSFFSYRQVLFHIVLAKGQKLLLSEFFLHALFIFCCTLVLYTMYKQNLALSAAIRIIHSGIFGKWYKIRS